MALSAAAIAAIGAGITAAGTVGTAGLQNLGNKRQAERSFKYNQMAIDAQNEYNLPVNQMQRYIDAGLNPNLMYGSIEPAQQKSIAEYRENPYKVPEISLLDGIAIAKGLAEIRNTEASTNSILSDTQLKQDSYSIDMAFKQSQIDRNNNEIKLANQRAQWHEEEKQFYREHILKFEQEISRGRLDLANKEYDLAVKKFGQQRAQDIFHNALATLNSQFQAENIQLTKEGFEYKKARDLAEDAKWYRNFDYGVFKDGKNFFSGTKGLLNRVQNINREKDWYYGFNGYTGFSNK